MGLEPPPLGRAPPRPRIVTAVPPQLSFAMFCHSAVAHQNGLISILDGGVDRISATALPTRVPLWFAARISWDIDEAMKTHRFEISTASESGDERVANVEGTLPPNPAAESISAPARAATFIVVPYPLEFRRSGLYVCTLRVDGNPLALLQLAVDAPVHDLFPAP